MANEVSHRHTATGATLYFTIRNTARQMWNTAGTPNFETLTVANWGDYDIALSESPASSYFYVGTFPAISGNMVAGWYWVDIYSGATAINNTLVASYFGYWDGTTFKWWGNDTLTVGGTLQTANDMSGDIDTILSRIVGTLLAGNHTAQSRDLTDAVLATAIWNAATASYGSAGSYGLLLEADIADILADTNELQIDWVNGGRLDLLLDAVATGAKLLKYVQLLARKDAAIATDNATELTAINADGGSGVGAYANTSDALENLRDVVALDSTVAKDATVSKPGTAQTITAPADMALNSTVAKEATANAVAGYLDTEVQAIIDALAKVPKSDSTVSWNATALASIRAEINTALDTAYTDATVLNTGGLKERLRIIGWILRNELVVDEATGVYTIKKDDGTAGLSGTVTDGPTETTRTRAA